MKISLIHVLVKIIVNFCLPLESISGPLISRNTPLTPMYNNLMGMCCESECIKLVNLRLPLQYLSTHPKENSGLEFSHTMTNITSITFQEPSNILLTRFHLILYCILYWKVFSVKTKTMNLDSLVWACTPWLRAFLVQLPTVWRYPCSAKIQRCVSW